MLFEITREIKPLQGEHIYIASDYAFDFVLQDPTVLQTYIGKNGSTSLLIDTLQLCIGIDTKVIEYVWGYCPHVSWRIGSVIKPNASSGCIRLIDDVDLVPGIALDVEQNSRWIRMYDKDSKWFCVMNETHGNSLSCVEFAEDAIAGLENGRLVALWICPRIIGVI